MKKLFPFRPKTFIEKWELFNVTFIKKMFLFKNLMI